jgi:hypothetical protein
MKRLSTALAPTLMTGALLGIGMASQAQTNVIALVGEVPEFLTKGTTFTLELRTTQNEASAATTTTQSVLMMSKVGDVGNRSIFSNVTWTEAPGLNPESRANTFTPKTTTIASGEYAGVHTMFSVTMGFQPARTQPANLLIGTYTFTIAEGDVGGFIDFGFAQANAGTAASPINQGMVTTQNLSTTFRSLVTTTNPNLQSTSPHGGNAAFGRPGGFRVGVVPGPSSLAVFALGGLAPLMGLIRRRRVAK